MRASIDGLRERSIQCRSKENELARLNPEYRRKYVTAAQTHADRLWKQAQSLFK